MLTRCVIYSTHTAHFVVHTNLKTGQASKNVQIACAAVYELWNANRILINANQLLQWTFAFYGDGENGQMNADTPLDKFRMQMCLLEGINAIAIYTFNFNTLGHCSPRNGSISCVTFWERAAGRAIALNKCSLFMLLHKTLLHLFGARARNSIHSHRQWTLLSNARTKFSAWSMKHCSYM